jgi:hypothetical protein
MTAEEIRAAWSGDNDHKVVLLAEIAAQLAECNENWLKVSEQYERAGYTQPPPGKGEAVLGGALGRAKEVK